MLSPPRPRPRLTIYHGYADALRHAHRRTGCQPFGRPETAHRHRPGARLQTPILILDDATSAVDVETETKIHTAIAKSAQGTTVVMVAQRISTVLNADKIIVLDKGRIAAEGSTGSF